MPNEKNLLKGKNTQFKAGKDAETRGRSGGIASGAAKRKKKDLRAAIESLLERELSDKNGNKLSGCEALAAKLFEQAIHGNVRAFEVLRDTAGQKPVEKVMLADVDADVVAQVEEAVLGGI